MRFHVAQKIACPAVLGMCFQEHCSDEVLAARMSHRGPDLHLLSHLAVNSLCLHGTAWKELAPVPFRNAAWRPIDATAKAPFVRSRFLLEGVVCVAFHFFHRLNVNPAFRLLDELFPALLSRQWRTLTIAKVKVCFQLGQFRVDGKV